MQTADSPPRCGREPVDGTAAAATQRGRFTPARRARPRVRRLCDARGPARRARWPWFASAGVHALALLGLAWGRSGPPSEAARLEIRLEASSAGSETEPVVEPPAPDVAPIEAPPPPDVVLEPEPPVAEEPFTPDLEPPSSAETESLALGPRDASVPRRLRPEPAPPPTSPPAAVRLTGATAAAPVVEGATPSGSNRPPRYPPESRARREEGVVVLLLDVDEDGRVTNVAVVQSSGFPRLDAAATEAALGWRYRPARADGRPVPTSLRQRVRFAVDRP